MNVPQPFQYYEVNPQLLETGKQGRYVAKTDLMVVEVQVSAKDGGETNLHSHPALDGSWLVLAGKARFYTEGDREVATLRPYQGLVVPRGTMYWFECASDDNLVIIRHAARDQNETVQRIDGAPRVDNEARVKEGAFFGK